ncbi:permeability factor 2 isoform X1 [Oryctolagus cuniculus]|uniref:permeability factor 2 isoform X1 n=1 Tax=Oryctolagus cuniculus TaxID=9986 RepID=UPI0038794E3D
MGIKGVLRSQRATEPGRPHQPQLPRSRSPRRRHLPPSPMAPAACPAAPSAPRLLRTALLLLLLLAASRRAAGAPALTELRCQCLQTVQGIHLKNIQNLKVLSPGPHCAQTEVIATLKSGQEACLNPAAPMVKKFLQKRLSNGNSS